MNQTLLESRKKKIKAPKGIEPSSKAQQFYQRELDAMIAAMVQAVSAEITPQLKRLKPQYTADARVTLDGWVEDIAEALRRASSRFTSAVFESQAQRIAQRTISMADADNSEQFRDSVNDAVGVDFELITKPQGMIEYLQASTMENVALIKSVKDDYLKSVEQIVLGGMKTGLAPTAIAKQLQAETGVSKRKAALIARDQTAKLNGDLTRQRQAAAGIEFYKAKDAGDVRVSGNPGGKYPNAKISCWGIARQDIGYGPGVYKLSEGASWGGKTGLHPGNHHVQCRCIGIAMIPGVNYFPEKLK